MPREEAQHPTADGPETSFRSLAIGLTSLFFIVLQSACTTFVALSGLRLVIGISSLAAAVAGQRFLDSIHGAAIRIPMETVAVAGSVINLLAVRRVRRLRARSGSQWRMMPVSAKKLRSEKWQVWLAVLTLLLVSVEWGMHIYLYGTI